MNEFELKELEKATENFSPSKLISKGSHGRVYRGVLANGKHVAIKKQSPGLQKLRDNSKIENEARILSSLRRNPCLVDFLGISRDSCSKIIVMEYMSNGTLHDLLHSDATPPPSWPERLAIALRIADGLRFLHESSLPSIVHRDIKSRNVLFGPRWDAKLADFGLSVMMDGDGVDEIMPAGTIGYLDPTYTTPKKLCVEIDVFSYGVLLLELISGREVFDVSKSPASVVDWAVPRIRRGRCVEICDKRVQFPGYLKHEIKDLLRVADRCLSPVKSLRPSMGEIVATLSSTRIERPVRLPMTAVGGLIREIVRNGNRRGRKSGGCGGVTKPTTASGGGAGGVIHRWWKKVLTIGNFRSKEP